MKIYTRKNALVGYLVLKREEARRSTRGSRRRRRSGLKVAAYVGLGLVSAGILAAVLAIALQAPLGRDRGGGARERRRERDRRRVRDRTGARSGDVSSGHGRRRRIADPPGSRRARSVRAGQARRGGPARARARARRQARVERGAVRAVPGRAGGDRARDARAQPLPRRRRVAAPERARRAARRRLRAGHRLRRRGRRRRLRLPGDARPGRRSGHRLAVVPELRASIR